jgi:hypothetical protein
MPTRVCTHRARSCPRVYPNKGAIMPMRTCTQRRDHAHVYMRTKLDHAYARMFYARMFIQEQSCPCVHAHITQIGAVMACVSAHTGATMPTRICTHRRDHVHAYMYVKERSCPRMSAYIVAFMHACPHTYLRSRPRMYAQIGGIMPTHICF